MEVGCERAGIGRETSVGLQCLLHSRSLPASAKVRIHGQFQRAMRVKSTEGGGEGLGR